MILLDVLGTGGLALTDDLPEAAYAAAGLLDATRPAARTRAAPVRAVVEVLHRYSGINPRALLGGRFTPDDGANTRFEVTYAADGPASFCPSMLWNEPFVAGLVPEFAPAVLDGLVEGVGELPAGVLRVDRAGVDEVGASELVFRRVAVLLRGALSARLRGVDVEVELRALFLNG